MQISGNLVAFILLATVVRVANRRLEKRDQFYKLFIVACRLVLAALFLEALVCVLDGRSSAWVKTAANSFYHAVHAAASPSVALFCCAPDGRRLSIEPLDVDLLVSCSVSLGMALFSHFHWLFFIDDSNVFIVVRCSRV